MYLPRGLGRNYFLVLLYDFDVLTANSVMNPATILSSQNSTGRVNLLFTYCNYSTCARVQSRFWIQFVMWLSFNLSIHSCSRWEKSQKKTLCKSVNTYLSKFFSSVMLAFILSFWENYSSLVLNQPSIYDFMGFQGLNIPF
jgi:hypothetical protein